MTETKYDVGNPCQEVMTAIQHLLAKRKPPVIVALDGGSGCGKSTIAKCVAKELNVAIIPCDDFFDANITDEQWDARTAIERAHDAIDWRRLRSDVLEPLIAGDIARWQAFDFESGQLADGTYAMSSDIKTLVHLGVNKLLV
jgi:uridine kinase